MNPLVLKDVDFHNKVQMGSHWDGQTHCYGDLEKIKQDCIRCALFWKDGYNQERASVGLKAVDDEALTNYILECFNKPGYAVPFTWAGGLIVFFYREENVIYFASRPVFEPVEVQQQNDDVWWQKFFKLFENK